MATLVKFRIEPDNGDVLAYFPQLSYYKNNHLGTKVCYAHVGQHSACDPDYVKTLRPANQSEYIGLKQELESIGYNLKICK